LKRNTKTVIILVLVCVFLTIIPFVVASRDAEFGGADDAAGAKVEEVHPDYKPWVKPLLEKILGGELPGETESLLFCIQAAVGSGVLCYGFGYLVARKKYSEKV
jgi:cobalt/nickel transport protein